MEKEKQTVESVMAKYGYATNRLTAEFIQHPIDYLRRVLAEKPILAPFALPDEQRARYEKDLEFLLSEQKKLA